MDRAWPRSHGEAIHTSTFLGHPVGCAMALAQIEEVSELIAPTRSKGRFLKRLYPEMRGIGLMAGLEVESGPRRSARSNACSTKVIFFCPKATKAK